jgi:hypothetical protein
VDFQFALIGAVSTIFGVVISFISFNRGRDKDVRDDASESAVIRTKLEQINSGVESIRIDIKANEKRVSELTERVIRIEESTKSAHKRLDIIETGGSRNE